MGIGYIIIFFSTLLREGKTASTWPHQTKPLGKLPLYKTNICSYWVITSLLAFSWKKLFLNLISDRFSNNDGKFSPCMIKLSPLAVKSTIEGSFPQKIPPLPAAAHWSTITFDLWKKGTWTLNFRSNEHPLKLLRPWGKGVDEEGIVLSYKE